MTDVLNYSETPEGKETLLDYKKWKDSKFINELEPSKSDSIKIDLATRLAAYYGLTGMNVEETSQIPIQTDHFFKRNKLLKVYDLELCFRDFKFMPELKKVSPDYFVNVISKYMLSDKRGRIINLHVNDNSNKLPMPEDQLLKSAISSLTFMFQIWKQKGTMSYMLFGSNNKHELFIILKEKGVFQIDETDEQLIHLSVESKINDLKKELTELLKKNPIYTRDIKLKTEDRIKEIEKSYSDFIKTNKVDKIIGPIARSKRIELMFNKYKQATQEEFKTLLCEICGVNKIK